MNYFPKEITAESVDRFVADTVECENWHPFFGAGLINGYYQRGFLLDEEDDSYLVVIPFIAIRDPDADERFAFRFRGIMYYIDALYYYDENDISCSIPKFTFRGNSDETVNPDNEVKKAFLEAVAARIRFGSQVGGAYRDISRVKWGL